MALTAILGPQCAYGVSSLEHNLDVGPSLFSCGEAFVDTRPPFQYLTLSNAKPKIHGFPQNGFIQAINATIYATATLASSVTAVAGVPLVLETTPVPGMTPGVNVREVSTNTVIKGVIVLDDFNVGVFNGTTIATTKYFTNVNQSIACWDPFALSSRRLIFTVAGAANTFKILGTDVYGYYVSETLVTSGVGTFYPSKAYKSIISVTPSVSDATGVTITTSPNIGLPLRYDYPGTVLAYEDGVLNSDITDLESSLYTVTNIVPSLGILTITISDALFGAGAPYTIPVGSNITISNCNPSSYDQEYTVLTSGPGTLTVASAVTDTYVSGGTIFCDQSGPHTNDVRGIYHVIASLSNNVQLVLYQSVSLRNMITSIGQFGVPQFAG